MVLGRVVDGNLQFWFLSGFGLFCFFVGFGLLFFWYVFGLVSYLFASFVSLCTKICSFSHGFSCRLFDTW